MLNRKILYTEDEDDPLSYLLVLDFEANCVKEGEKPLKIQEILEFPVVIIDIKEKKIVDIYHQYIKPQAVPKVAEFCTELTGITQEMVDKGILLQDAIKDLGKFLEEKVIYKLNIENTSKSICNCYLW